MTSSSNDPKDLTTGQRWVLYTIIGISIALFVAVVAVMIIGSQIPD